MIVSARVDKLRMAWASYARSGTIHGLVYLVESKTKLAKILWLVCITASAITAVVLIVGNIRNWQSQPSVVTEVNFDAVQVSLCT